MPPPDFEDEPSTPQESAILAALALGTEKLGAWRWPPGASRPLWSPAVAAILGDARVRPGWRLIHRDERRQAVAWLKTLRRTGAADPILLRIARPGGGPARLRLSARALADGTLVGLVQDCTLEDDLEASRERYGLILENARDYAIFTTDPQGRVTTWPPGAEAVLGWTAQDVLGRHCRLLFVPEDRANGAAEAELDEARRTGSAPDIRWHQHKDGSRVFIEGVVRPLLDADGALQGFFKIGRDMTGRREQEGALKASEQRFRTLATAVPDLVFLARGDGARSWSSPQWQRYTGLDEERSAGWGWLEAVHPDDREAVRARWSAPGVAYWGEHRLRRAADGAWRWHQARAVPLDSGADADAEAVASEWVGSWVDIHDIRVLRERQELLVAELQHRTRNLLAVVRAVAGQTLAAAPDLASFREAFDERLATLSRVQGLVSSVEEGGVEIGELLRLELSAVGADWRQIVLSGPRVPLRENAVQTLALALHELCTNALKYGALADPDGRLDTTWRTIGQGTGAARLILDWRERRPSAPPAPMRPGGGFGRQLIEQALPYQLGARTRFDLTETGLHCRIELPLA